MALDATLVSAHHGDGTPLRKADTTNGVALRHARKRKEDRYPELCGTGGRARMVVIAGEVGARWSGETANFRAVFGTTQGEVGTENFPGERPGRVLQTVEQSVVLFGSESVRN